MKTTRRNGNRSEKSRNKKVPRSLKAEATTTVLAKVVDQARFQQEAAKAWIENAGVGGVEDLYSR